MAHVLVIDDDEDITRLLQTQLTEEGHAVTIAHQGEDGMAKALKLVPDLIMLDVFLPDATGFQICSLIRKNNATKAIPVILMTGAARFPSQQMFGMERGANEYISKPFDVVEISELIHKYIGAAKPADKAVNDNSLLHIVPAPAFSHDPISNEETYAMNPPEERLGNLAALNTFLEQANRPGGKKPLAESHPKAAPAHAAPIPQEPAPMPQANFVPPLLSAKERFIDFGMEIYQLASRLSANQAETFLANQLLRASLSVGARITDFRSSRSAIEFWDLLQGALRDLRETAYWLTIARKAGVLESLGHTDLEKTCQSLLTLLNDFALTLEKQRGSR